MIKKGLKKILQKRGYYLRTIEKNIDELRWIANSPIKTIIDIGAHKGESYRLFRRILPNAAYIGFEPINECFSELKSQVRNDTKVSLHPYALSAEEGKATFYLTDNSHCSSLLEPEKSTSEYSGNFTEQEVVLKRLDDIIENPEPDVLIKIDVQGNEENVLKGGRQTISKARIVIIEISFEPLYVNQPDFSRIYQMMTEMGFVYKGAFDQFARQADGLVMQQDAIFMRP